MPAVEPARLVGDPSEGESARLVGDPVRVGGIFDGPHGISESVEPGKPGVYYSGTNFSPRMLVAGWCWTWLCWPISFPIWLAVMLGQLCSPCCFQCLGERWCYMPSQISYTHSLYVVWHSVRNTWLGYLCCCGWFVKVQPGVLFITTLLATPPKFIFDEDEDEAFLMTFEDYAKAKAGTSPPYSGKYRAVDGGGNHRRYTFVGQGGRGYAMNEPYCILRPSAMPNPVAMQEALQLRTTFKPSPWGQNCIATWFANVAIHDFFRSATGSDKAHTNGVEKPWVNLHSGYLDCQVLYGWNEDLAKEVRTLEGGKLSRVADNRLSRSRLPESFVIIELLRREHNFVCDELAKRYPDQFTTDEQLYQQARLVMGGVYINVILRQYGDEVFGENAPDGKVFAELRHDYADLGCGCVPASGHNQTVGNHSTLNFNLIYRWHTGIPEEWGASAPPAAETDDDIRQILKTALSEAAGGFGPNNMPQAMFQSWRMTSVPAAAVLLARECGAPRFNDFRRRFGPPYTDFLDMCGDPEVAAAVAKWYDTVEDVELAVGCQVEKAMSGGWALGQTVGRAIIADAFSSIRQDRFYTTDFHPGAYTEWGYQHATSTVLVDIINRHLQMDLPRDMMLSRLPSWQGPPKWSEMKGWPFNRKSFDARGYPDVL